MEWVDVNRFMPPPLDKDKWLILRVRKEKLDIIYYFMGKYDYELSRWFYGDGWNTHNYYEVTHWCVPDDVDVNESVLKDAMHDLFFKKPVLTSKEETIDSLKDEE